MKGGFQGLRRSQVSLTLIGLVCVTVLAFTWMKTTMLTSFVPSQSRVLQLDLDKAGPGNTLGEGSVDSPGSSGISERENIEIGINKEDTPASIIERTVTEEVSERKSKPKQAEIAPENFLTIEPPLRIEQTRNLSATTGKEESPSILERTGYDEHPGRKNKSKQAEIVPDKSVKTEQSRNLSAITGKKIAIMPKVNGSLIMAGLYILASIVSNGCHQCGPVA
ncbi:hypothetical protein OROGR_018542 [Orobanche gracilis]